MTDYNLVGNREIFFSHHNVIYLIITYLSLRSIIFLLRNGKPTTPDTKGKVLFFVNLYVIFTFGYFSLMCFFIPFCEYYKKEYFLLVALILYFCCSIFLLIFFRSALSIINKKVGMKWKWRHDNPKIKIRKYILFISELIFVSIILLYIAY